MKTYEICNTEGQVVGFEIDNTFVGRWRACRVARDMPRATVLRWPRRWACADDEFCEFKIDGARFVILEPFGDNSRYQIVADPPAEESIVTRVRSAFANAPLFDWRCGAAG